LTRQAPSLKTKCLSQRKSISQNQEFAAFITLSLTANTLFCCNINSPKKKSIDAVKINDYKSLLNKGISDKYNSVSVHCDNTCWLSAKILSEVQDLLVKGLTVFCVAMNNQVIAAFGLSDSLRLDSCVVITELQKRNITVSIVSGDDAGTVKAVALKLSILTTHVRSKCTSSNKQEYLRNLMTNERRIVLFCSNNTNDAVALAQADIDIHMNSDSNVAQTAVNIILMRLCLNDILMLLDLFKAVFHCIIFNFVWSFVYNLFTILLAAGAFVNARILLQYAELGEIVSVLSVILIALQLRWFKQEY
jgi:Cu2+-exporting ATPase